ncbi:MAG: hypothetical protein C7B45_01300 [Sulfobacillus acidophilus]|uniref:Uncharacterized protein n=1 Tax=Sulfobacillus acidophilus TaxID=53633 RepID=A0A2T2WNX8_9FIRM|nr:MAG: hypothetical protein C7B45_01300 [Sulfobacillus acidophilus]
MPIAYIGRNAVKSTPAHRRTLGQLVSTSTSPQNPPFDPARWVGDGRPIVESRRLPDYGVAFA